MTKTVHHAGYGGRFSGRGAKEIDFSQLGLRTTL
jgi:hypothetical protein